MCKRPFASVDEMDAVLIERWNTRVKQGETVYILGDFAWRNHNHYLRALNGSKVLICGNHDKMSPDVRRNFTAVYGEPPGGMKGNTINGKYMVLSHYPQRTWNARCWDSLNLFGHVHSRMNDFRIRNSIDVGVDNKYADFAPLEFEEILKLNEILPYVSFAEATLADSKYIEEEILEERN